MGLKADLSLIARKPRLLAELFRSTFGTFKIAAQGTKLFAQPFADTPRGRLLHVDLMIEIGRGKGIGDLGCINPIGSAIRNEDRIGTAIIGDP